MGGGGVIMGAINLEGPCKWHHWYFMKQTQEIHECNWWIIFFIEGEI